MYAIKEDSVKERNEQKKNQIIFSTYEKRNEMNFKNAIAKVFEDKR